MNDIGARIKARRKQLGCSAERLAEMIGVSPATIYRYEKNEISNMGADKLRPIAEALGTTPGALMGWDDGADDAELWELRETLRTNPGMRLLFQAAKGASAEDLRRAADIVEPLKRTNPAEYDGDDPA